MKALNLCRRCCEETSIGFKTLKRIDINKVKDSKFSTCLKQSHLKDLKIKKITNFVKPPNSDSDTERENDQINKTLMLPRPALNLSHHNIQQTEEKEKFYKLLSYLKDKNKKFKTRSISSFARKNTECLPSENKLEIQTGVPTLASRYLQANKNQISPLAIDNQRKRVINNSYMNKTQDYSTRRLNISENRPLTKANLENGQSGKFQDFPPINIHIGQESSQKKSFSRNYNSSVESKRVPNFDRSNFGIQKAYPSRKEFKKICNFLSDEDRHDLLSIHVNTECARQPSITASEEELDIAIKNITKIDKKNVVIGDNGLINLYQYSQEKIREKLEKKLQVVTNLNCANKAVKLSKGQQRFLFECKEILKTAIKTSNFNIFKVIKLTISGDLFLGETAEGQAQGYGVILTNKNSLIEGNFKDGIIEEGKVKILYPDGEMYVGLAKTGGCRHGEGIHYYSNGDIYDGEFLDNQRVGKSRLRFHDGSEYIGQFIEDTADGHGLFADKEGNRYMSLVEEQNNNEDSHHHDKSFMNGYFLKGKLYGKGEIKYKNGDCYVGILKGTKRHGKGTMAFVTNKSGTDRNDIGEYEGKWVRDRRDGTGKMIYANGEIFQGIWKNDRRYKGELSLSNGQRYEGRFLNNQYHGRGTLTLTNGTTLTGNFEYGVLLSPATIQFTNGRVYAGEINGYEIGRRGKLVYANGDTYEGTFEDRRREGDGVLLMPDGSKYEGRWKNDKKDGFGKEYNASLNEYYEGRFDNNRKEGKAKFINRKGEVFYSEFKNNKKPSKDKPNEKITKKEYAKFIKEFMKSKEISQPIVRILA
ncbi:unnamed protein product [Moneuplotes crassus]|uniref:Phosphatidylinositol-4-phosphate 5-kinase n=1 Tax=Euplotes crassus TaxID=5936 RepID=A0AAD2D5E9_EUPCR|nr:unnamed protein product [Moneuplotes crassus]